MVLSIRARIVCFGLFFVAGMVWSISVPFVLVVGGVAKYTRIIHHFSTFTDLMLLRLCDECPP